MTAQLDARAMRSRRALLDSGIELLLRNPAASLSQIASHAGVGRATLYRHFETRDQLIQTLAVESLEITDAVLAPSKQQGLTGRPALESMLKCIMPLADHYHFLLTLWNIAEQDQEVMQIYNRQLEELAIIIEQGKAEGSISQTLSTGWIVATIDSLLYTGWWMMGNEGMSAEEAADSAITTLFKGIG